MRRCFAAIILLLAPATAQAQTPTAAIRYYHLDAIGSVRVVTDDQGRVLTDGTGQEVGRHDFEPFGEEVGGPSTTERRLFTSAERDFESGFDYLGARFYWPDLGRFTTGDPGGLLAENLYVYVMNDPLMFIDPTGMQKQELPGLPTYTSGVDCDRACQEKLMQQLERDAQFGVFWQKWWWTDHPGPAMSPVIGPAQHAERRPPVLRPVPHYLLTGGWGIARGVGAVGLIEVGLVSDWPQIAYLTVGTGEGGISKGGASGFQFGVADADKLAGPADQVFVCAGGPCVAKSWNPQTGQEQAMAIGGGAGLLGFAGRTNTIRFSLRDVWVALWGY